MEILLDKISEQIAVLLNRIIFNISFIRNIILSLFGHLEYQSVI